MVKGKNIIRKEYPSRKKYIKPVTPSENISKKLKKKQFQKIRNN